MEKYDTEHKFSAATFEEKVIQQQWMYFQASGQGYVVCAHQDVDIQLIAYHSPYFGQCGWFRLVAPLEQRNPVVAERYQKEILRVFGVLDSVLSKQEWLVGGRPTVADVSFVMWVSKPRSSVGRPRADAFISWNYVAITLMVNDYNGFNLEKDFPSMYR